MSEGTKHLTQGIEQGYTIAELDTRTTLLKTAGTVMVGAATQNGLSAVQTWADAPTIANGSSSFSNWTPEQVRQYFEDQQQIVLNKAHV